MTPSGDLSILYSPAGLVPPSADVSVAISGGGSRSLSAAMGQLRGLRALGLLDQIEMIGAVSGGAWASALFTYLPTSIADADFLGQPVAPADIDAQSLAVLPPHNLGTVPQRLSFLDIFHALKKSVEAGCLPYDLWQGVVGDRILKPFGLWDIDEKRRPTQYYTATNQDAAAIVARNAQLSAANFLTVQRPRPRLVMQGTLFANPSSEASLLLPFQSTSTEIGVPSFFPGRGVGGQDIGGGVIETVGMGATFQEKIGENEVRVTPAARPFALSDMLAISSSAFVHYLQAKIPLPVHIVGEALTPTYRYWPVGNLQTKPYPYLFGDGGLLESTAIPALLSRGARKVIAFINSDTKPARDSVDHVISNLFGQPDTSSDGFAPPADDPTFCQVFRAADLAPLIEGLWTANQVNHGPAMFTQRLHTLANTNFGVPECDVEILWVYNVWVDAWCDLLPSAVRTIAAKQRDFFSFPYYDTIQQLDLSPVEVNLLAHLSCWNLQTNEAMVRAMF